MADEIKLLLQVMQEAGEIILASQKTGITISKKVNSEIVTHADIAVNEILKKALLSHFPQDGWLSEESVDDVNRLLCRRVWIVDPIDGTKEFAQGIPEYAISVALIEEGIPILSAVYNPPKNELFYAIKGQGAWLGERSILCRPLSDKDILLLASRSEYARGAWNKVEQLHTVQQMGSIAYKMALIAAGRAQATFSLGPKNEWDVAGAALLVTEAGGIVSTKKKEMLKFNQKQPKINSIVATTLENYEYILYLMKIQENS